MAGLDSYEMVESAVILSVGDPDSTPRSTSLSYLLRYPTLISLSSKNFRLLYLLVSCPDLYDNHTVWMGFSKRDMFG